MISICIPVYNFNVTELINQLSAQLRTENLKNAGEIIIIDDCSDREFQQVNEKACSKHTYIKLEKNVGRSKIRNLFLQYVTFNNLLFLDCDGIVVRDNFISKYRSFIETNAYKVVCGGRIYDNTPVKKDKKLRWKYGILKESQPVDIRLLAPNKSFMTNNFLIKRDLLESIKFEESLTQYGHEDTLFGYQLKQNGIKIHHIDNPILNGDIETNNVFLSKTKQGLANLVHIVNQKHLDKDFMQDVSILNFYLKTKNNHTEYLILLLYKFIGPIIYWLLKNGFVNLTLFNFYKLGYLIKCFKKSERNDNE